MNRIFFAKHILFFIGLILSAHQASGAPLWSVGASLEAKSQRDLKQDYDSPALLGGVFARLQINHWGGMLEFNQERRDSSSGGLKVSTISTALAGWGRFDFLPDQDWHPMLSLGVGSYFDRVESIYGDSEVERKGSRYFGGLGAVVARSFWSKLLLEGEGRVLAVEGSKDMVFSALLRAGVQF